MVIFNAFACKICFDTLVPKECLIKFSSLLTIGDKRKLRPGQTKFSPYVDQALGQGRQQMIRLGLGSRKRRNGTKEHKLGTQGPYCSGKRQQEKDPQAEVKSHCLGKYNFRTLGKEARSRTGMSRREATMGRSAVEVSDHNIFLVSKAIFYIFYWLYITVNQNKI